MPRIWTLLAAGLVLCTAAPVAAQTPKQVDVESLRKAGNELRFRVIKRFSGEAGDVSSRVAWPYSNAVEQAVRDEQWKAAWQELKGREPASDEKFAFLYGYVARNAGEHARAVEVLEKVGARRGLLSDYAYHFASRSAFDAKAYAQAAALAARVESSSPLHASNVFMMGHALLEDGQDEQGIRSLKLYLERYGQASDVPAATLRLADALVAAGDYEEAAELYVGLARRHPLSSEASTAEHKYEAIRKRVPASVRKRLDRPEPKEVLVTQRALFGAHRSERVIEELSETLAKWKKGAPERCEALYLVAQSHTKLRKHSDSIEWYRRVISECRDTSYYLRALYKGGKGFWNAGRRDEAVAWYEKIWTEFADHSFADDALYFAARILHEKNEADRAAKLLKTQVEKYPSGDMASDALWLVVRNLFASKKYDAVVAYVDGLEHKNENDLYSRGRLDYFRARALQLSRKAAEAKRAYRQVVRDHPMSYYALLAFNRLAEIEDGGAGKPADVTDVCAKAAICAQVDTRADADVSVPGDLAADPVYRRGRALLDIALPELAKNEFGRLRRKIGDDPERLWALAHLLHQAKAYPQSHDIPRRHIPDWEDAAYPSDDHARWAIAYPRPFGEEVKKWAKVRGLPAEIIYAIMREESGFNPRVTSWAGAVGLMQLMPSTAKTMARVDGFADYAPSKLHEPDTALRIGTAYLKDLADRSDAHPVLVIAGYNGGWGNVSRWLKSPDSRDVDLWVEDIPYGQTRNYTKRVLRTYWIYNWLQGSTKVPRFAMSL